ncbi:MAG: hypothetical protein ACODAD_07600 [Planctomycetota bacterium]
MNSRFKKFGVSVTIAVILVGAGFGALTGVVYNQTFWWAAAIVGGLCGYPLARVYLRSLKNSLAKGRIGPETWLYGTFVATLCGVVCTGVVHATMMGVAWARTPRLSAPPDAYVWPTILFIGVMIGAGAGFVVGGICSLLFVLSVKAPGHETE